MRVPCWDVRLQAEGRQQGCPPYPRQYRNVSARLLWQASPPDVDHAPEREPQGNHRCEPGTDSTTLRQALRLAAALRVDPGAVKPDEEHGHRHDEPESAHGPERRQDYR